MISIQERLGLLTEPIEGAAWQWACMLRSSIPGIVVSFDSDKQTCVVRPAIQELVYLPAPGATNTTQNIPTSVSIDPLQDVPICMMRVPGWSITLPITTGTECLLLFSDACIDGWWETGQVSAQYDRRRHDLSDAIALFGPWSQPNKLTGYSTTSLQIRSDDQSILIDLAVSAITIKAPSVVVTSGSGTPSPVMTGAWQTWFTTYVLPHITTGVIPSPPSPTSILEAE